MSLERLAVRHGTDKAQAKVGRLTPKGYTAVYEPLLEELHVEALLELGIARGASLRMWAEYLPDALIIGVDKNPGRVVLEFSNVQEYRGDQADRRLLERIARDHGPFQAVIDDGSHRRSDQLASFGVLWPHVTPGGFYAIEDLHAAEALDAADLELLAVFYGPLELELSIEAEGRLAVLRKPQH